MLSHKLHGITVVREYDPDLPPVPGYGGELNQVWTNLVVNAVEAMGDGDGSGTLTLRTARDSDAVLVDVVDDGPGVPPEVADRIFDAFFTTKAVGVGSGLGLDISRRIVETRHQGLLSLETEPGRTCFRVRLPIAAPVRGPADVDADEGEDAG
jgi:signal transduction histidine kinase